MTNNSFTPNLSVVMPVRNEEAYLEESITSILAQSLADFEFVILDDASTDRSLGIIKEWARKDRRIRVVHSETPLGVVGSAARVVRESGGSICARMDADDVAHPDRLRRQLLVLETRPDVCLVGTLWEGIDADGRRVRPTDRSALLGHKPYPPFPHGSVMFRRSAYDCVGGYRETCRFWEDRDLFLRMSGHGRLVVIPEALYQFRYHLKSSRLNVGGEDVRKALGLMHHCLRLFHTGQDYTRALAPGSEVRLNEGSDLVWLNTLGSQRFWAGYSPGIFGLLRRSKGLGFGRTALGVFALAVLGGMSPSGYRLLLRWRHHLRDWRARRLVPDGAPVEWIVAK